MVSSWIDPSLLKTFLAVVDGGSFAAAADRIGRTQSAVSMQMKRLEEVAGSPALFIRTGRAMKLTPRAEAMVLHARRVLVAHEEMAIALGAAKTGRELRLGTPEDYVSSLLPKALDRFAKLFPTIEVNVVCDTSEELRKQLSEQKIDLAVVTAGQVSAAGERLRDEPLVWAASAGHWPEQDSVIPLAVFQPGCVGRKLALDACIGVGLNHRIAYSSPSLAGLLAVVRQGLAIAPLARCSVPDGLRILTQDDGLPPLPSLVIAILKREVASVSPLVDALEQEIRNSVLAPQSLSWNSAFLNSTP